MSLHRLLPVVLVIAACKAEDRRTPPPAKAAAAKPALANATQHDLARELEEAMRRDTWREVRSRWQGQRLSWTVTRYRALCASGESCNVAPFPVHTTNRQGWMPQVTFAPGQYEAMASMCADRDPCEVKIEGTLVELDATGERATKLKLGEVVLAGSQLAAR